MSEIASRVKAIIVDKLGVDENEVTLEASFTNDLGARLFGYSRAHHGVRKGIRHSDSRRPGGKHRHGRSGHLLYRGSH